MGLSQRHPLSVTESAPVVLTDTCVTVSLVSFQAFTVVNRIVGDTSGKRIAVILKARIHEYFLKKKPMKAKPFASAFNNCTTIGASQEAISKF